MSLQIAVDPAYVLTPRLYVAALGDFGLRLTPNRADAATFADAATASTAVSRVRARLEDDEVVLVPVEDR